MKGLSIVCRILTGLLISVLLGCSSLLGPFAPEEGPYGFGAPSVPPEGSSPLPVEIAKDIEAISEDGVIYYQNPVIQVGDTPPPPKVVENAEEQPPLETEVDSILSGSEGPLAKKSQITSGGPLGAAQKLSIRRRVSRGGKTVTYVVKKGDTLMEIAFDKHGDYLRWREIYNANRKKMTHWKKMKVGTLLSIHNVNYVLIKKDGKPYLIRKGDTLKSIAKKLYGSPLEWKRLWKNNPQLVRNPKKIYAGFTLYYPDSQTRPKSELPEKVQVREPSQAK